MSRPEILMPGRMLKSVNDALDQRFTVHRLYELADREPLLAEVAPRIRAIACGGGGPIIDKALIDRLPALEIVANFGVGYDNVDAKYAATKGIIVTNTPDVLTEEVADTALGLLLNTVREFPQAERYLRAGKWPRGPYPLTTGTLRDRTVGIVGLGRIGKAIARRLQAFDVPVVYHNRSPQPDVSYRYYPDLITMAKEVDTIVSVLPGGAATDKLIGRAVFDALGPRGIVVNIGRGTVVDEAALIEALTEKRILGAGLDVFEKEPQVPEALIALENCVLLPHVGSASLYTRDAMGQRVIDNLTAWDEGKPPLSPVGETPFTGWKTK
ncbi:2-hydroxyacid dehydrogenase [Kaistia dalseonensis]|uniref:Lactate dehydrogenase-like 2-hydroxyacid dehydrogenase n=1 Tax=Kaistia dalseonensis TaxID=410840 RepID=A0ABU0HCA8_9HYPH|nr:2-hydroxyacid dehydrogenase [Kaistia dalseonensis]MCX5496872.1 2-hydroxyacid dehydrogenase [Kaistia dalseonensis]MDQ0439498.1 lactate dehydrogenase-like 2-hydroxyacid dehydrogenase [Kaistia dalseonensis]